MICSDCLLLIVHRLLSMSKRTSMIGTPPCEVFDVRMASAGRSRRHNSPLHSRYRDNCEHFEWTKSTRKLHKSNNQTGPIHLPVLWRMHVTWGGARETRPVTNCHINICIRWVLGEFGSRIKLPRTGMGSRSNLNRGWLCRAHRCMYEISVRGIPTSIVIASKKKHNSMLQ